MSCVTSYGAAEGQLSRAPSYGRTEGEAPPGKRDRFRTAPERERRTKLTDIIIIGAGTAGMTAAIYARRAGRSAVVFEETVPGGQIINTPDIENYPGIAHISGYDFASGLSAQMTALGAELRYEGVREVRKEGKTFTVITSAGSYEAGAVIIAAGARMRPLGVAREAELTGHGVSYCATCDGMFFRGKKAAVVGGGNTALEDAVYLSGICSEVVLIHRRDAFRGSAAEAELLRGKGNVSFMMSSVVTGLIGGKQLSGIEVRNQVTGRTDRVNTAALFIAVGQIPSNGPFAALADLDAEGYLIADETCALKTPGLFAAGDCRTKNVRQLTTAAADGAVAALGASRYLESLGFPQQEKAASENR